MSTPHPLDSTLRLMARRLRAAAKRARFTGERITAIKCLRTVNAVRAERGESAREISFNIYLGHNGRYGPLIDHVCRGSARA